MSYNIEELLKKYKDGSLTKDESIYLNRWYNFHALDQSLPDYSPDELKSDIDYLKDIAWKSEKSKVKSIYYSRILLASLILLIGLFCFLLLKQKDNIDIKEDTVVAGTFKAELLLHSGEKVQLDSITAFKSIIKDNVEILKAEDGTLQYNTLSKSQQENSFDELTTPKGGEYKLQLVDGTKVWLNANSKLRFFTSAGSDKREVWLEGEGFFEVSKDYNKPFIVYTSQQKIKVTGTSFNIVTNKSKTQTTLVDGSVSINEGIVNLKVNEQLTTINSVNSNIQIVDVSEVIAWKNGYFIFNDRSLIDVLRILEDWYDVQFVGKSKIQNLKIWATISKHKDIDEILKIIQLTGVANFERKGRRVEVKQ